MNTLDETRLGVQLAKACVNAELPIAILSDARFDERAERPHATLLLPTKLAESVSFPKLTLFPPDVFNYID